MTMCNRGALSNMTSKLQPDTSPQGIVVPISPQPNSPRSKSLMETILAAKMEPVAIGDPTDRPLVRTDSANSDSSLTSSASDVCRCDDCLLGIADLYQEMPDDGKQRKKVGCYGSKILSVLPPN